MNLSSLRPKHSIICASLATLWAISASSAATAQVFFQPFGYAFHRPIAEPEPDVSPRRMAFILARHGFRLIGPLGYRGQQIVAAGVDARGLRQRFLIDPYEGRILTSWPIGPRVARGAPFEPLPPPEPYDESAASGEPRVISGVGPDDGEPRRPARTPRAATPPRAATAARSSGENAPHAAPRTTPSQSMKAAPKATSPAPQKAPPQAPAQAPAPATAAPTSAPIDTKAPPATAPAPQAEQPAPSASATQQAPVPAPSQSAPPAQKADSGAPAADAQSPTTAQPPAAAEQPKTPGATNEADPKSSLGG